jgi:hypothetical protein
MPWVHPFTSVISGPTGSGTSVFARRFVENMVHMMSPIPHRILWCYGEHQALYGTVDGVDIEQGLLDLDKYMYLCIEIPIQLIPMKHYQK